MKKAYFGAGCFWGVQAAFDKVKGVVSTRVGYMGGNFENPTYEDVCTDTTGHAEVVEVIFDPEVVSYEGLLGVFFNIHDPTTLNRQGVDVGTQYRSIVFYCDDEQGEVARKTKQRLTDSKAYNAKIVTQVVPVLTFYPAEEYHQKYLEHVTQGGS